MLLLRLLQYREIYSKKAQLNSEMLSPVHKFEIIILLDSVSIGLIYPFLSTYIQLLGADHVAVGILSVGYLICNLISAINVPFLQYGKHFNLVIALFVTLLTHLILIRANNYWYVIFGRFIYSFVTNQSQCLCKDLLLENSEEDKKESTLTILGILSGVGYIIGPITAGYLFDYGFIYIGLLAILLAFINIYLAISISYHDTISANDPVETTSNKIRQNINDTLRQVSNSDYQRNWDMMTIKFLHTSCVTIFYGKFSQILKHNFQSSSVTVGLTYAYMNGLTFASTYFTTSMKQQYDIFSPVLVMENSYILLCICLFIACYSPVYALFMIMCIPIIFLTTFINSIWKELFATRKCSALEALDEPLKIASGMTTPLVFGAFCNAIGHHAVIMFSVIPTFLSLYIIKKHTKNVSKNRKAH